jgi:hypothetical protein
MKRFKRIGLALLFALCASSVFPAQDPSVLLEKAIYTEETLGNLGDAIGIYQQVLSKAEATRVTLATAQFRLGICYQKIGHTADAQAAFSKLSKLYPEQQSLISKIPGSSSKGLGAHRAPWMDGEELQFVDEEGNPITTYRTESAQINGKASWSFQTLTLKKGFGFSKVSMDASSLMPLRSVKLNHFYSATGAGINLTDITTIDHTPGVVEVLNGKIDNGTTSGSKKLLAFDQEAFDPDQLDMILRTLPLREGFQTVIPVINQSWLMGTSDNPPPVNSMKISVPVRDKIAVPAGSFECFKVVKSWSSGSAIVYWISTDDHAYIVKIEAGQNGNRELKSIKKKEKNQPVTFEDREFKISAPSQWFIRRYATQPKISIIEPDADVDGALTVSSDQTTTLEDAVNKEIELNQKSKFKFKSYDVRPESRASIIISGLPAISYIADIKGRNPPELGQLAEYAFYFAKSNKIYKLYFQTSPNKLDGIKNSIDSIASSLIVK